jgi:hypothetical protein
MGVKYSSLLSIFLLVIRQVNAMYKVAIKFDTCRINIIHLLNGVTPI